MNPETSATAGNLSHEYRIDFRRQEAVLAEALRFKSGMTAKEYAEQVVSEQLNWSKHYRHRASVFVEVIEKETQQLIDECTSDDIHEAVAVFSEYGIQLRTPEVDTQKRGSESYLSWACKVRKLAGYTNKNFGGDWRTAGYTTVDRPMPHYSNSQSREEQPYSTVRLWQEVYSNMADEKRVAEAAFGYVLGPNIEAKDPDILLDVVERTQTLYPEDLFGKGGPAPKNPEKIVRIGYDSFNNLVNEANDSGWKNAGAVQKLLTEAPKRDMPLHSVIIMVGNTISDHLENAGLDMGETGFIPGKRSLYDLDNVPEAINRCLYLMFELGEQPKDRDPLNYIISGQIFGQLFPAANRLLRKT